MGKRCLNPGESPQVGDVFQMFDDAFSTAIVTHVHEDGSVDVERPMMQITGVCPHSAISIERLTIDASSITRYKFYTTAHEVQNRWYDEQARKAMGR